MAGSVTLRLGTDEQTPHPQAKAGKIVGIADDDEGGQALIVEIDPLSAHGRGNLDEFEQAVVGYPQVLECYSMAGGSDYLLKVVAKEAKKRKEASAAYTDEAYAMTRKGQAELALGAGLVFSAIGGLFGAVFWFAPHFGQMGSGLLRS